MKNKKRIKIKEGKMKKANRTLITTLIVLILVSVLALAIANIAIAQLNSGNEETSQLEQGISNAGYWWMADYALLEMRRLT
ncbi:MAG: hypothetical protein AABW75_03045 [Nanoarchaeota archaeon]|mgnify:CR=1 FL=1